MADIESSGEGCRTGRGRYSYPSENVRVSRFHRYEKPDVSTKTVEPFKPRDNPSVYRDRARGVERVLYRTKFIGDDEDGKVTVYHRRDSRDAVHFGSRNFPIDACRRYKPRENQR